MNAPIDGPLAVPAPESTLMHSEAAQAADVVAAQFKRNADAVAALAAELRASPPAFIATCARGSSDHAATYAKYLFETQLGVVTASLSPTSTVFDGNINDQSQIGLWQPLSLVSEVNVRGKGPKTILVQFRNSDGQLSPIFKHTIEYDPFPAELVAVEAAGGAATTLERSIEVSVTAPSTAWPMPSTSMAAKPTPNTMAASR